MAGLDATYQPDNSGEVFNCAVCGRESAQLVARPFESLYNQMRVRLDSVEMYDCTACGESVFTPEQAAEVSRRVKAAARERLKLLEPEAIGEIRKRCDLSQEELERLCGLDKKVVARWEKGRSLQSKTADVLLRLMDKNPAIVEEMRQIHS